MALGRRAREALDRIDPDLGAFITVNDSVLRAARSEPGGRLRGLIVAVKDLFDTTGMRTTYGSPRHRDHVPRADAALVAAMLREGAVLIGKTNLNEYAYGVSGLNPHFGPMLTPRDRSRTAGGSSGGSAVAVAAGMCDFALGTDTSGSVRIPAACCNIFGFKLANASSSLQGVFPLAPSYDSTGFLAPDIGTLERVINVSRHPDVASLSVAVGEEIEDLPPLPHEHWVLFRQEAYAIHRTNARLDPGSYGDDLHLKLGAEIGDVPAARIVMKGWRTMYERALSGIDVIESEVFAGEAPTLAAVTRDYRDGTLYESRRLMGVTPVANALGWPAMTVPTEAGPRHLLARPGAESALLARAAAIGLDRNDVLGFAAG